ncbi:MAG: ABC transporter permease [Sedimentisphaerales bacterium]|nr:ABC transporter permease [Sedimentisphaerales bacterium]
MNSIWAIARNTIAQALRMKIAGVVIVLLLILLPMMSMIMIGDGTLLGKLQTFSSYGLSLVGILLCILTIAISTFTLSDEIKRRQIFLVVTKPVRRWQILAGKFLGIVIVDVVLLGLFSGLIFGLTLFMPRFVAAGPDEVIKADDEFFTARMGLKVSTDEEVLQERVKQRYEKLKEERRLPETMTQVEVLTELMREERLGEQSVEVGRVRKWTFKNVYPSSDPNTMIFIRYKLDTSNAVSDVTVYGLWAAGDLTAYEQGADALTTPIYNLQKDSATRAVQEFAIPVNAVNQDGTLEVGFMNNPNLNTMTVIVQDLEVLYKVGTFSGNFWRATLLIAIRLFFLAALGITLTTWLSFPVAVLGCLVIFSAGIVNGFIMESIDGLGAGIGILYTYTIKPFLLLLPQFDGIYNPTGYIVSGRIIQWLFLLKTAAITIGLKGLILFVFGIYIFYRREVAKSVV